MRLMTPRGGELRLLGFELLARSRWRGEAVTQARDKGHQQRGTPGQCQLDVQDNYGYGHLHRP